MSDIEKYSVVHFLFAADDGIIGGVFRAKLDIIGVEVDAL